MDFRKIIAVIQDVGAVLTTGEAVLHIVTIDLNPPFEKLEDDAEEFVTAPSWDGLSLLVTDAKALSTSVETNLSPSTPEVVALKSAVAALELELASK